MLVDLSKVFTKFFGPLWSITTTLKIGKIQKKPANPDITLPDTRNTWNKIFSFSKMSFWNDIQQPNTFFHRFPKIKFQLTRYPVPNTRIFPDTRYPDCPRRFKIRLSNSPFDFTLVKINLPQMDPNPWPLDCTCIQNHHQATEQPKPAFPKKPSEMPFSTP